MVFAVGLRLGNSTVHVAVGTQYLLYIYVPPQFGKSVEGAVYIKRKNQIPPKIHDLMYFVDELALEPKETHNDFMEWLTQMGITTRYPEDLKKMIKQYTKKQTNEIYQRTQTVLQWIKDL